MEKLSLQDGLMTLSKLTLALDYIGDAVFLVDDFALVRYANPRACHMLEYSQAELILAEYRKIKPSFTIDWWKSHWQSLRTVGTQTFEITLKSKTGKTIIFEAVGNHIVFEGQEYSLDVMRDVTERKALDRKLLRSEKEFRSLAENSPDVLVRYDTNVQKLFTNPAYDKTINDETKRSSNVSVDEVWSPLNISQAEYKKRLLRVMETGQTDNILLEWINGSDELVSHIVQVVAEYNSVGKIASCLAIGHKISNQRKAELQLRQREQYLRTLLDNFPFMVWLKDTDSHLLAANTAYAKVAGVATTHDLEGKTDFDFFPQELAQQYVDGDQAAMQNEAPMGIVCPLRDAEGKYYWIESYKSRLIVDDKVVGTVGYARDVTETLQREREYHSLIENSPNSIVRFDRNCHRIFINPKKAEYYGVTPQFLLGKSPSQFPGGSSAIEYEQKIQEVFANGLNKSVDLHWQASDGKQRVIHTLLAGELDANGQVMAVIGVGQDVTEAVENQARIHHLAFFDSLTDLPNRALLTDRLNQAVAKASRHKRDFVLMMLDLDRFKEINDTLGHVIGDLLLCEVARRLEACLRSSDTVARLGGDEFAVLLSDIRKPDHATNVACKIIQAFTVPFLISGKELFVTTSIGIVVYPSDSKDVDSLLKYADSAMYHAKQQGRNNFQFYSAALTIRASERMSLETSLRKALLQDELELYYQPQVDLQSREIIGVEALLRWHRDHKEMISPDKFIGIAEESGLIIGIGEWVISTACKAAVQWNLGRVTPFTFAINLSTRQFILNDLVGSIERILRETGCKPEWLKFEITESLLLDDNENIQKMLHTLHDMGLCISIDDFGTGYSALSYLNRFPVSQLKIDRSFVQDITINPDRALLVQAIISMSQSLRKSLIAEGVETNEQAILLAQMGCAQAQGYLFGKPMPYSQLKALFGNNIL